MSWESAQPKWSFHLGRHPNTTSSQRRHLPVPSTREFRTLPSTSFGFVTGLPASPGSLQPRALFTSSMSQIRPTLPRRWRLRSTPRPWAGGCSPYWPALVGLAVIGQALGRQSVVESEEYPSLVALGLPRRQLVVLGTARNLMVALVGAAGAVIVAFALSPLTPVGEARLAEPSTGLAFDPLVLLLGALATVVVVLLLGIWPTVRASRVRAQRRPGTRRPPVLHRGKGGRHGRAAERGDRSPSRLGARTRRCLGPGGHRTLRIGVGGHGPVRNRRLRRQLDAPHGYSRALRQRLPVVDLELERGAGQPHHLGGQSAARPLHHGDHAGGQR